jgi:hypothetical protein
MNHPRMLGKFSAAAKSYFEALLQTHNVRCRLLKLDFQPMRSHRIANQGGSLSSEQRALRNLLRKRSH